MCWNERAYGVCMTPDALVRGLLSQIEAGDEPAHRWTAWGPLCLVCHRDMPEGHAVAYPFLLGSCACLGAAPPTWIACCGSMTALPVGAGVPFEMYTR